VSNDRTRQRCGHRGKDTPPAAIRKINMNRSTNGFKGAAIATLVGMTALTFGGVAGAAVRTVPTTTAPHTAPAARTVKDHAGT
jgi:hypothetical protein